jgi:predicted permease
MKPQPVAWSLRLFRALASAYPHEFRNVYGDEMLHMAEDAVEPVWRRHGVFGIARLLADVALRIPVEYAGEIRQDVRYGLRMLRSSPGFTVVALLSLTLGIGVATSAFSEMNGFVLREVPGVQRPAELVALKAPVSYESFRRYRERADLFSSALAYMAPVAFNLSFGGRPERTWGHLAAPSYFATLGVVPALGRFFTAEDRDAVVVSYRLWQDRLGSDPAAIGKTLRVNGHPCWLAGVAPPDFRGASPMIYGADVWMPLTADPAIVPEAGGNVLERRDRKVFHVVARLQPGVATARAEAALDAIARQMEREDGAPDRDRVGRRAALGEGGKLMPLDKKDIAAMTAIFAILGGLILLIACANVANMMLARAAARRKEMAMRLALGAGRARLVRQLLIESLLLSLSAGGLGFLLTVWLMRMASQIRLPYPMPLEYNLAPDGRVAVFCLTLSFLAALAFGLGAAIRATGVDLTPALKESGAGVHFGRNRRINLRNVLMTAQMAASLALLLITGFLVVGHRRMNVSNVGFDAAGLSVISFDPIRDGYTPERTRAFFARLTERLKRLPPVSSVALADTVPMTMIGKPTAPYLAAGDGAKTIRTARRYVVSREFFETIGMPVLRGRSFRESDEADRSMAAIVSEKLARESWPGLDPVGRRMEIGEDDVPTFRVGGASGIARSGIGTTRLLEVVGVARDVRDGLTVSASDAPAIIYLPLRPADYAHPSTRGLTLLVRAAPGADAMSAVRREVAALDDRINPFGERALADSIEDILSVTMGATLTYSAIGVFGLVLASVGLAGVTAYNIARRRREIGIRMAIGARQSDVLRLVMKEGLTLVAIGAALGLLGGQAGIRAMSGFMAEIARTAGTSTSDPMLLVGAPLLLAAVALAACYLPARQSARIDPVKALRQE